MRNDAPAKIKQAGELKGKGCTPQSGKYEHDEEAVSGVRNVL